MTLTVNDCLIKCKKIRGRSACWNPCFTPGEYEYKTIQSHLNNPCSKAWLPRQRTVMVRSVVRIMRSGFSVRSEQLWSKETRYWRKYFKSIGRAVPPLTQCNQTKQRSLITSDQGPTDVNGSEPIKFNSIILNLGLSCPRIPASDCITVGEFRQMDPMSRCLIVKLDQTCPNTMDLLTADEMMRLERNC